MLHKTPLHAQHQQAGAKLVDFGGWEMPLHYGSHLNEHHAVRKHVGIFDVSHMNIVDVRGTDAQKFLRYVLANDVAKLTVDGKALYTCMLNPQGNVIDDLIVYRLHPDYYRLILNASTREKDLAWLQQQSQNFNLKLTPQPEYAIIAVQGPNARALVGQILGAELQAHINSLAPFTAIEYKDWLLARTGYTGEDGLEIMLPANEAENFWKQLIAAGAQPCGLAARDSLRLEAGLNLYGHDMDETTSPLESNLAWTIAFDPQDRNFIGRKALEEQQKAGVKQRLVGLMLEERGVLRNHQKIIIEGLGEGEITSGSFSPTLNCGIALARIPVGPISQCWVDMRGKKLPVKVGKPAFVRQGKKTFQ